MEKQGIVAFRAAVVATSGSPAATASYTPPNGTGVQHVDFPAVAFPYPDRLDASVFAFDNDPSGGKLWLIIYFDAFLRNP